VTDPGKSERLGRAAAALIGLLALAAPGRAEDAEAWRPAGCRAVPMVGTESDHVRYLDMTLFGRRARAMIDSAATGVDLLAERAELFLTPAQRQTNRSYTVTADFAIGGTVRTGETVSVVAYPVLAEAHETNEETRVDVVMGIDTLAAMGAWLDYGDEVVWFPSNGTPVADGPSGSGWASIALAKEKDNHFLTAPVRIGERSFRFLVDTGSGQSSIMPRLAEGLALDPQPLHGNIVGMSAEGYTATALLLTNAAVGSIQLPEWPVLVMQIPADVEGIVGAEILLAHGAWYDTAGARLFYHPARRRADVSATALPFSQADWNDLGGWVTQAEDIVVFDIQELVLAPSTADVSSLEFKGEIILVLKGEREKGSAISISLPAGYRPDDAAALSARFSHDGSRQLAFLRRSAGGSTEVVALRPFNALRAQLILRRLGRSIEDFKQEP
jgi:hypothetical protein